jgi:hypothetical protein
MMMILRGRHLNLVIYSAVLISLNTYRCYLELAEKDSFNKQSLIIVLIILYNERQ